MLLRQALILAVFCTASVYCQCPGGWMHHDEGCYFLHSHSQFDWVESAAFCDNHNAHLAYIEDESENAFIKGLIMQNLTRAHDAHVWLGGTDDIQEGTWRWYLTDQPVTFFDWGPGEPNSVPLHIREDCLVYWQPYNWKWADLDCHDKCYFICEKSMGESGGAIIG